MLHLGVTAPRARPATAATDANARGLVSMYVSTLGLTLANPTTILSFGALFAGLGLGGDAGESSAAPAMALGVLVGSALWWLLLTGGIGLVRRRLTPRFIRMVNGLSGLALVGFGLLALASMIGPT